MQETKIKDQISKLESASYFCESSATRKWMVRAIAAAIAHVRNAK